MSTDQIVEALVNIAGSIERRAAPKVNRINVEHRVNNDQEENEEELESDTQHNEYQVSPTNVQ